MGTKFRRKGPKWQGLDRVLKRLDRAFCSGSWTTHFQEAVVQILTRIHFDHHPLLIKLEGLRLPKPVVPKPFRFESAWLQHSNFSDMLKDQWCSTKPLTENLSHLSTVIPNWNHHVFGNLHYK